MSILTPSRAIDDMQLLGVGFQGASWDRWRAILRAAYGERLRAGDLALFREVAERDPPRHRVKELWVIAGRRSGKDSIASAIACAAALGDYTALLRPGERASVLCLASDRTQARIVFRYVKAYFQTVPLLRTLIVRETEDELELSNGVEIVITANSFRAVRGRSVVCAIFDEVAFWRSDESANPDSEIYAALLPAMATFNDAAMLVGISSPYRRQGLLFDRWRDAYGKNDPDCLVVRGATRVFNPTVPQRTIDTALARDPESAGAEWMAQWRSDIGDFLDRELVESAIDPGVKVRSPQRTVEYSAFADPSGGRGDSFTVAVAHSEGDLAILDCLYERRAPFNPSETVAEIAAILRSYGVGSVVGDRYAAEWVVEAFAKVGISYVASERDRSALYLDALPLFTAGLVRLLDDQRLKHQIINLERRTSKSGRDRVDHPPGQNDDAANSCCGALVNVVSELRPGLVRASDLLGDDGLPVPVPRYVSSIFVTCSVNELGRAAVCYWASTQFHTGMVNPRLVLLDFEAEPLSPGLYSAVRAKLLALLMVTDAAAGVVAVFCPAELIGQFMNVGLAAEPYPEAFKHADNNLMLAAAGCVGRGDVKITAAVVEKAQANPFGGALSFRAGDAARDDPLRHALIAGIVAGCEEVRHLAAAYA
jgi:hypothetical protein